MANSVRSSPRNSQRIGVLLTEGSSSSARQTIYALASRYRLGVLDPHRLCLGRFSRLVRFHRCPHFGDQPGEYLRFVSKTMRQGGYDVLFPTHDQVYLLSRFHDLLDKQISVVLPDFDSLSRLQSKVQFQATIEGLDLPCPSSLVLRCPERPSEWSTFPCFVKVDHATAGAGVQLVEDPSGLDAALNRFALAGRLSAGSSYLVQQSAAGIHSVVQAVFQHGNLIAVHCAETIRRGVGGGQGLRVGAHHPTVVDHMRRLGQHLHWHGPLFLEYFYDSRSQRPAYIEANPRIGETLNATLSGTNLCELVVRMATGESVSAVPPELGMRVRSHTDFLLLLAEAVAGANRRQLLRTVHQILLRSGDFHKSEREMTRPGDDWVSLIPAAAALAQLLISPASARKMVEKSVRSYSLTDHAVETIRSLSDDAVRAVLHS